MTTYLIIETRGERSEDYDPQGFRLADQLASCGCHIYLWLLQDAASLLQKKELGFFEKYVTNPRIRLFVDDYSFRQRGGQSIPIDSVELSDIKEMCAQLMCTDVKPIWH